MAALDYYVDTAVAASGDGTSWATAYKTLAAALLALAQDLTVTGNQVTIHCRASTGAADTTAPSFSGWNGDATRYLTIQTDAADRHAGIWDSTKYRLQGSFYPAFNGPPPYTRFVGLQVLCSGDDVNTSIWRAAGSGLRSAGCQVLDCVARWTDKNYTYGSQHFVDCGVDQGTAPWVIRNCLMYGATGTHGRTGSQGILTVNDLAVVENCTLLFGGTNDAASVAISDGYSKARAVNVLTKGWASFGDPNAAGTDYNAADVAGVPGTHSRSSQTFTFVDAANAKYQLAATDAGARGFGTDLSADASWPFTDDIAGVTRTTPWDIGAFVAAGGSGGGSAAGTGTAGEVEGGTATGTATLPGTAQAAEFEGAQAAGAQGQSGAGGGAQVEGAAATGTQSAAGTGQAGQVEGGQGAGTQGQAGAAVAGEVEGATATGGITTPPGSATGGQVEGATATGSTALPGGPATAGEVEGGLGTGAQALPGTGQAGEVEGGSGAGTLGQTGGPAAAGEVEGAQATGTTSTPGAGSGQAGQVEGASATGTQSMTGTGAAGEAEGGQAAGGQSTAGTGTGDQVEGGQGAGAAGQGGTGQAGQVEGTQGAGTLSVSLNVRVTAAVHRPRVTVTAATRAVAVTVTRRLHVPRFVVTRTPGAGA